MADEVTLLVRPRTTLGKQVRRLRREGVIPANIFGRGQDSRAVEMEAIDLKRLLAKHAGTRIVQLQLDGTQEAVLIRHVQHDPRTGAVQHVDFLHVDMREKIRARVPVRLTGEAPAVKQLGGVLLHVSDTVEVECLPSDLPERLELDVGGLENLDDTLYVRDLSAPAGVVILADADETVAKVTASRMAAVAEAAAPEKSAAPAEGGAASAES
ncbi:MAG TPA: 50S ribosomal protein L25 [Ktedonobacterales bacterium]|jgi:large subunit ribosomal protein L25